MPVEFKDYYTTLGVARDASEEDIKKAFRSLARQYHPDVARDKKTAEAKFKEINEANEVLSDPAKRRKYDELGADWQNGGARAHGRPGGFGGSGDEEAPEFHFNGTGFSDFFEQFFGGSRFAGGAESGGGFGPASARGRARRGRDIEGDILITLAEAMHGTTRPLSLQTVDPATGERETHDFDVRIPPGAVEGRRIRVPGKGGPGTGGGPAGDLFLHVRHAAHPDFRAQGTDLYHEVELAPWEAALGVAIVVPSLGGPIKLRIPPGTNHGRQLRVPGHGLPKGRNGGHGALYVVVHVQIPPQPTDAEKALWEQLARTSTFKPRAAR